MIALSTAWNAKRAPSVRQMLEEIRDLGFSAVEVGYTFSPEQVAEMAVLMPDMGLKVVSVHNYCPLIPASGSDRYYCDQYRISSLNETERGLAVAYTKRTIDSAAKLGAGAMVLHAGTVEGLEHSVDRLLRLFKREKMAEEEFVRAKDALLAEFLYERRSKKRAYIEKVVESLAEIMAYAHAAEIRVGLETRYYPSEIPDFEEVGMLLGIFGPQGLGYWHDMGHAETHARLGIVPHESYLKTYGGRLIGIHMHDIKGIQDHLAPFTGEMKFDIVLPYLRDDIIQVIEAGSKVTAQDLRKGLESGFFRRGLRGAESKP